MNASTELSAEQGVTVPKWSDDPANAKNWSPAKRIYNTAIPSLLCFTMLADPSYTHYQSTMWIIDNSQQILWTGYLLSVPRQRPGGFRH